MTTKTIICDNCAGEGRFAITGQKCMRCNGQGTLTERRIRKLLTEYFPRRLRDGQITRAAFNHQIQKLETALEQLGVATEDPGCPAPKDQHPGTPAMLDTDMCRKHGVTLDMTLRELKARFPAIYVDEF